MEISISKPGNYHKPTQTSGAGMHNKLPKWYKEIQKNTGDRQIKYEYLHEAYVYLRSIRNLFNRASTETYSKIDGQIKIELAYVFTEAGFSSILDVQKIVHSLTKINLGPDKTFIEKKQILKIPLQTYNELSPNIDKRLKAFMKNGQKQSSASEWKWRLQRAIKDAVNINKWYPLFGTYTVDPKILSSLGLLSRDELFKKTPAWDRFVKRFKTEIADSLGYGRKPSKWPKNDTFLKYFAVLEHGKSGDHPHIHVIWLCKNIPKKWKVDPNDKDCNNTQFDIPIASRLWKHGQQRRTQGIFITGSPFIDKLKWKTPRVYNEKTENYDPIKVGDANAIGGYIAKYLGKGTETKKWNHRVKCTRNLGIESLRKNISKLNCIPILNALAWRPPEYHQAFRIQRMTKCPLSLLRRISKTVLKKQWYTSQSEQGDNLLRKEWVEKSNTFYTKLIDSVSNGVRPWSETPHVRYSQYTQIMEVVESTVHCKKILNVLKKYLDIIVKDDISCIPFVRLQEKTGC